MQMQLYPVLMLRPRVLGNKRFAFSIQQNKLISEQECIYLTGNSSFDRQKVHKINILSVSPDTLAIYTKHN